MISDETNVIEPHTPQLGQVILPMIKSEIGESNKRKREDNDYDVP